MAFYFKALKYNFIIFAGMEQWSAMFNAAPIETTIISSIALLKWIGLDKAIAASMLNALTNGITLSGVKLNVASFIGLGTSPAFFININYSLIFVTTPEPTVRPPSRIAKRRPSSIATGAISSTVIFVWSPGITISVPSGREIEPVTSVVLK